MKKLFIITLYTLDNGNRGETRTFFGDEKTFAAWTKTLEQKPNFVKWNRQTTS